MYLERLRSTQGADGQRGGENRNGRACRMGGGSRQCCRLRLDAEAKARRDSLARQEEAEADSERVREVERQVRAAPPRDPWLRNVHGGMCSLHESRFRALCMAVSCGSAAKPTPAPLGRMLSLQS